ncbi:amidohydrolase [Anaerococcus sp.]|jgi:amidohydrolase|uniref:amidohydrolase n=1 Tax=Anaerococcus sp. TaxID=1872515 RepID=UPI0025811AAA|nr:amidohydrolase [Anaerococcus sp.]MBS6106644.1 amidohydrolase [Anaerococcus sp.]
MSISNDSITKSVEIIENYLVKTRRYLHENPELSGEEFETSKFLKSEVQKLNLPITEVEGTGFYAILDTEKVGKTIGLRTDIDALPIVEKEENQKSKRVCKSKVNGKFHACGHDGHMAILLAAMHILVKNKDNLKGKIIFIFEEGEEICSGIGKMVEALEKEKIDAIYGAHLAAFLDTGKIAIDAGPVMAGNAIVDFTVRGKGGHGSRPDLSINPIFAATNIINGLASAWVNRVDVRKTVTLGLGMINGGTIANVIPDEVRVAGTLRYFDIEEGKKALEFVRKVGSLTAEAHECQFIENKIIQDNDPVINDKILSEFIQNSIEDIMPDSLAKDIIWFASESFAGYSKLCPTALAMIGTKNKEVGSGAEHHNEYFDIDEKSLTIATTIMVKFAYDFLKAN